MLDRSHCILCTFHFFNLFSHHFFIPASDSDTDYTSSFNVNNNINNHQNYPRYSEGILFHNTASSTTTTTSVRNVLLHVTKTLTMFTFIHIMHSVFVSFHQWKLHLASTQYCVISGFQLVETPFKMGLMTFCQINTRFNHQHQLILYYMSILSNFLNDV